MLAIKAEKLARQLHSNQVDKAGQPYTDHLQAVVNGLCHCSDEIIAVAWLHDSLEDTNITLTELKHEFGATVAEAVCAITKQPNEKYQSYLERVKANEIACVVKLSDLAHNMDLSRLSFITQRDLERQEKYKKAKYFLMNK